MGLGYSCRTEHFTCEIWCCLREVVSELNWIVEPSAGVWSRALLVGGMKTTSLHCPQLIWVQNSIEDQNFSPDQPHNIINTSNIYTARMLSSSSNFFSSLISIPLTSHSSNLGPFNNLFCFLMAIFLMAEFCYNFEFCDAIVSWFSWYCPAHLHSQTS